MGELDPQLIWFSLSVEGRSLSFAFVPVENEPVSFDYLKVATSGEVDVEKGLSDLDRHGVLVKRNVNGRGYKQGLFSLEPQFGKYVSSCLDDIDDMDVG